MSTKTEQANEIIQYHVMWAMGAGAMPIPIADIAAVTVVQMDMLKQLSRVYGVDYKESSGKNFISALVGSTLARLGASFVKSLPGVGSVLGSVSMVILSGASTYSIARVFVNHFESGGTFFDFDLSKAKKAYEEEFQKGKEYAKDLQKTKPTGSDNNSKAEIFAKLSKLAELKKSGVLSEDEFNAKKEELLGKL
ncbi:MAG: DUF697 domain-containing protein [Bacteroidia bacterium]|nr:DUF697 domain-containing protein [Bacteroidia bacterium]